MSKKKDIFKDNHTLQTLLQDYIDKYVNEIYGSDATCPPKYVVSIYKDKLMLTITHGCSSFSEIFFPEKDMIYGMSTIKDKVDNLYNRTM